MIDAPTLRLVSRRILREAAWAPVALLLLHAIVLRTPYRAELDGVLHFLGGAAVAFFFYQVYRILTDVLGEFRPLTHYLLAFALACTAALFWELGEFASDRLIGTQLQKSLPETMADLAFGVLGAATSLCLIAVVSRTASR